MSKDAADDPYSVQRRPFVLPCADCGEAQRVRGLRRVEGGTINTPLEPLCADCLGIESRVWGERRMNHAPPSTDTLVDYDTDQVLYVVLCPRCNGTGMTSWGMCFGCMGERYSVINPRGVRAIARWWQTYQQNRTE